MKKKIESNVEITKFAFYDEHDIREIGKDVSYEDAVIELKCSEELLKVLVDNHNDLVDMIHLDLVDLYKKLD